MSAFGTAVTPRWKKEEEKSGKAPMRKEKRAMPPEVLLQMLRKQPFQPFRIHVLDGTVFEIRHPEMVMPGKRWFNVGLLNSTQDDLLFDRFVTVATMQVSRLEPIEAQATS
jgi:hypothetical protein